MTRLYARAAGGVRVHESAPEGNWKILTILGAMSTRGMIAAMTVEAATDREIFLAFLDEVLCPALRPGGWGYAVFNYDAVSGKFTADDKSLSDCGNACHTAVKAKDYMFHPYEVR